MRFYEVTANGRTLARFEKEADATMFLLAKLESRPEVFYTITYVVRQHL
jgi:hypothetical protein